MDRHFQLTAELSAKRVNRKERSLKMSFINLIDNAEVILEGYPVDSESFEWAEFCRTEDGKFFFAEYKGDCKRSDAKIFFVSNDEAKNFIRETCCPLIYDYYFYS